MFRPSHLCMLSSSLSLSFQGCQGEGCMAAAGARRQAQAGADQGGSVWSAGQGPGHRGQQQPPQPADLGVHGAVRLAKRAAGGATEGNRFLHGQARATARSLQAGHDAVHGGSTPDGVPSSAVPMRRVPAPLGPWVPGPPAIIPAPRRMRAFCPSRGTWGGRQGPPHGKKLGSQAGRSQEGPDQALEPCVSRCKHY